VTFFIADLPFLRRIHPPRTIPRSRVSGMRPLVVGSIRVLLLGAVKCAQPGFGLRSDGTRGDNRFGSSSDDFDSGRGAYRHASRDFRLADVRGKVVEEIIA